VLTSYVVAAAIMTPLSGWLADRYGRKKVLVLSVVVFTVSSAMCGLAQSLGQIVLFRLVQGLGGAALVPQLQRSVSASSHSSVSCARKPSSIWIRLSSFSRLGAADCSYTLLL